MSERAADERWRHCRFGEPHDAQPDLSKTYVQRGTGRTEASCLDCGEAVVRVDG